VNNLKFEGFQIEKSNAIYEEEDEDMEFFTEENKVERNLSSNSKITTTSNNLFHLRSNKRNSE
jgi:hypothetical protein